MLLSGCTYIPTMYPMVASQTLADFRSALARRDINETAANYYDLSNGEQQIARQELKAAKMTLPGLEPEVAQPVSPAQPSVPSTKTPFATGAAPSAILTEIHQKEGVITQLEQDANNLNNKVASS